MKTACSEHVSGAVCSSMVVQHRLCVYSGLWHAGDELQHLKLLTSSLGHHCDRVACTYQQSSMIGSNPFCRLQRCPMH